MNTPLKNDPSVLAPQNVACWEDTLAFSVSPAQETQQQSTDSDKQLCLPWHSLVKKIQPRASVLPHPAYNKVCAEFGWNRTWATMVTSHFTSSVKHSKYTQRHLIDIGVIFKGCEERHSAENIIRGKSMCSVAFRCLRFCGVSGQQQFKLLLHWSCQLWQEPETR